MLKKFKLGVIGAGFMASSIVLGAVNSGFIDAADIVVSDIIDENLKKFSDKNINVCKDNGFVFANSEYVLLAVKPQNFADDKAFGVVNESINVISIMAGVKKSSISKKFVNAKVVRCMPNAPCFVNSGAIGVDFSELSNENEKCFVNGLLSSVAKVIEVNEKLLNTVTGISGSAPAYFYLFAQGLIQAGMGNGLTEQQSRDFVVNTMIGSGKMLLKNNNKDISSLIDSVCSKGGTTIEAINVYNEGDLSELSLKAVNACIKRSQELENL